MEHNNKNYVKSYFLRGLLFSGFGPIIAGIVFLILDFTIEDFSLTGKEILLAIVSTYILAFVQAGASIFNQIEGWSIPKSLACHLSSIYLAYLTCYLLNSWIPLNWKVILIFTVIFLAVYFIVWIIVYLCVKATSKKLNKKILNTK